MTDLWNMYFYPCFTEGKTEGNLNQRKQWKVEIRWVLSGTRENPTQGGESARTRKASCTEGFRDQCWHSPENLASLADHVKSSTICSLGSLRLHSPISLELVEVTKLYLVHIFSCTRLDILHLVYITDGWVDSVKCGILLVSLPPHSLPVIGGGKWMISLTEWGAVLSSQQLISVREQLVCPVDVSL